MNNFTFPQQFRALYDKAVGLYAKGQRGAATFFSADENAWLAANGINAQHLYDYAEDHNGYGGEPGFEHALTIETVRRDYFFNVQGGKASATQLDEASLPAKSEALRGIAWLPRILPKARAKLRGELPPSLMYCCGGDRKFFKENNLLPAEFLAALWRHENNEPAFVDWVAQRVGKQN